MTTGATNSDENGVFTDTNGVKRRTIMTGAAWTIPAVAVAVASPARAASQPSYTCPVISNQAGWVGPQQVPGSWAFLNPQYNVLTGSTVIFNAESGLQGYPDTAQYASRATVYRDFPVKKGVTYTFSYYFQSGGNRVGTADQTWATSIIVRINGVELNRKQTRSQLVYPEPAPGTNSLSGPYQQTTSWTADADGTARFEYEFWAHVRPAGFPLSDVIVASFPTIACTGI